MVSTKALLLKQYYRHQGFRRTGIVRNLWADGLCGWIALWGQASPVGAENVSLSPKAGHNKAGRSDFRNQRFEPDTAKMRKMRKAPLTLQKKSALRPSRVKFA